MTYYGGRELAASFRTVRRNTIQIAEDIPEAQYGFRAAEGTRTVAETLAHIALLYRFQTYIHDSRIDDLTKVNFPEFTQKLHAEEAQLRSKTELIALLISEGERFATYLEGLTESALAEQVAMFPGAEPPAKSRFEMLLSPKEHEMHHRGQLMVLQRLIGMAPHLTRERHERAARAAERTPA